DMVAGYGPLAGQRGGCARYPYREQWRIERANSERQRRRAQSLDGGLVYRHGAEPLPRGAHIVRSEAWHEIVGGNSIEVDMAAKPVEQGCRWPLVVDTLVQGDDAEAHVVIAGKSIPLDLDRPLVDCPDDTGNCSWRYPLRQGH